ncbi:hypothetical protein ACN42_g9295 [Penicillium freii]|uniref:Uncharacterized protein n=1 Tax=Penicillium freii TaxID=48697 RepID=A0A124GQE7_PENFR|nr:hypothetical protein ACN42_g9295 [Penicillium freii]
MVRVAKTKAIFEVLWHRQPAVAKCWTPSEFQRLGLTAESLLSDIKRFSSLKRKRSVPHIVLGRGPPPITITARRTSPPFPTPQQQSTSLPPLHNPTPSSLFVSLVHRLCLLVVKSSIQTLPLVAFLSGYLPWLPSIHYG